MNLGWMNDLCAKDKSPFERISIPFNVTIDGVRWRCATEGHAIVMVEIGDLPFPEGYKSAPDPELIFHTTTDTIWTGDLTELKRRVGDDDSNGDYFLIRHLRIGSRTFNGNVVARTLKPLESTTPVVVARSSPDHRLPARSALLAVRGEYFRPWVVFIMGLSHPEDVLPDILADSANSEPLP